MDISLYYQILDTGILYEKGKKNGKLWRIGERRRLREEILFWQKVLEYISEEKQGITCVEELFKNIEGICSKYKLPNYERILEKREELIDSSYVFERNKDEEFKIHSFMERLLVDMKKSLDDKKDKEMVYRILTILHNLPKAMHGRNIISNSSNIISYDDALKYAKSCMNEKMQKEYEKFLL